MFNESEMIKENIRSRINTSQVIGRYVKLKASGQNMKGLCPFHKEKSPSFTVNPDKGVYHCFGCGKGGDVFNFLMEIEGLTFPEALKRMADETGISLASQKPAHHDSKKESISKSEAIAIHEIAARFYYESMKKSKEAVEYLKLRHLKPETVKTFRIGYAPKGWSNLIKYAGNYSISEKKLIACGLAISSSQGDKNYDRFRERIIFPIFDVAGKPIAFAGRGLEKDAKPKYLNSPETSLYRKNRILYGLHSARRSIKDDGQVIFVEGYMDFLSLYQADICNVVATSGTALTEEHVNLIRRFTTEVVLVFDGDTAGYTAAQRAAFMLVSQNIHVRVFLLPKGEDPDSFIQKNSREHFLEQVNKAYDGVMFLLEQAKKKFNSDTAVGKSAIVNYMLPIVRQASDLIIKAELVKQIAEHLDLRESLVYGLTKGSVRSDGSANNTVSMQIASRFVETEEGSFLHIILKNPALIPIAQKNITAETFTDFFTKKLYSIIVETYKDDTSLNTLLGKSLDAETKSVISLMLVKEPATGNQEEDLVHKVKRFLLKLNKNQMHNVTISIKREEDIEKKKGLMEIQKSLIIQRGEIIKGW